MGKHIRSLHVSTPGAAWVPNPWVWVIDLGFGWVKNSDLMDWFGPKSRPNAGLGHVT